MVKSASQIKVVLAHDSLTQLGGAERVFLALAEIFEDAPIYVLVADEAVLAQLPQSVRTRVHTTKLQWFYRVYPKFQHLLPFIPFVLRFTKLPDCRILLSSSSAFAKGFRRPSGAKHINYCHTPTRFLWTDLAYVKQEVPWALRFPARVFLWWMKCWDLATVRGVDMFLANSKEVQKRILQYYNRESELVYPFVDTQFWRPGSKADGGDYFLIAGRLHAHKHNDLVVRVCTELGIPLHVVGAGRDEGYLKSIAGPTVRFLGRISDAQLRDEYTGAKGYIYPQLEDFGLMPLEAAACGTPTIGINEGGSRETIVPGVTGEWFSRGSADELKHILQKWDKSRYDKEKLHAHAEKFSLANFQTRVREVVERAH